MTCAASQCKRDAEVEMLCAHHDRTLRQREHSPLDDVFVARVKVLLHTITNSVAWMDRGTCAHLDITGPEEDIFFCGGAKEAREMCDACPVRAKFAAYSLRPHEDYGIWGGLTEHERRLLRKLVGLKGPAKTRRSFDRGLSDAPTPSTFPPLARGLYADGRRHTNRQTRDERGAA